MLEDVVYWIKCVDDEVVIEDIELVFVGYGVVVFEYGWNDYEGIDVCGKIVVMLVNDFGYGDFEIGFFNGNVMIYYGCWIYKYEEVVCQGVDGVIVIYQIVLVFYGWNVVLGFWIGLQLDFVCELGEGIFVGVESWIIEDVVC